MIFIELFGKLPKATDPTLRGNLNTFSFEKKHSNEAGQSCVFRATLWGNLCRYVDVSAKATKG